MIAASARGSGTSAPDSSNLNRGCCASFKAAAFARARALRVLAATGLRAVVAVFLVVVAALLAVVAAFFVAVGFFAVVWPAHDACGTPTASTAAKRQIDRRFLNSRARITGNPFSDRLLRRVSAL
jgi:hypothetical protein